MSIMIYFYRFKLRMKFMRLLRPELRRLMANKTATLELELEDRSVFLGFNNGIVSVSKSAQHEIRAKMTFRTFHLAQNVIRSAMEGDQFWLAAMRDHRVSVTGDMSVVLWLFSLCRHLPLRLK
ncbi:MAG TPA: hypothetical protein DHW71_14425 [Gammaproteobacteria bacterium]|nr:hypothetical protein [Gammaproteobacteria bacterium]MEC8009643.1 hypothetical protein [Pseudomonadota bacterium]HBF09321.1 hypothetical protein [Gammaproteobacteria bacterium]HCK94189.1 hypothetical protein [Gammaproteobacteria bacterium]|tara:strand:- start:169 stop:537 length:369 start_codon:yes stop_codon:yes gene_type:complete